MIYPTNGALARASALGYAAPLGLGVDIGFDLSDVRRALQDEIEEQIPPIASAVLNKLKPEIPGLVKTATDAAIKQLEPKIPGLVEAAIEAAQSKIYLPLEAKAAIGVVGALWLSAGVFSFLAWKQGRRR